MSHFIIFAMAIWNLLLLELPEYDLTYNWTKHATTH